MGESKSNAFCKSNGREPSPHEKELGEHHNLQRERGTLRLAMKTGGTVIKNRALQPVRECTDVSKSRLFNIYEGDTVGDLRSSVGNLGASGFKGDSSKSAGNSTTSRKVYRSGARNETHTVPNRGTVDECGSTCEELANKVREIYRALYEYKKKEERGQPLGEAYQSKIRESCVYERAYLSSLGVRHQDAHRVEEILNKLMEYTDDPGSASTKPSKNKLSDVRSKFGRGMQVTRFRNQVSR